MLVALLAAGLLLAGVPPRPAGGYGEVEFANSGAPAAQADFLAGLAMLHDFEYETAAEAFRRAEAADPGFAMAVWGEAMTYNHPIWMQQDLDAARAALAKLGATPEARRAKAGSEREKGYLGAVEILYDEGSKAERDLRYEGAMERLHEQYPDDVNVAAFYGLSILGTAHAGRDIPTYMRAAGVLEEAWMNHREHPGLLHYLIHCYDDPAHAPLGLRAARLYARIAPDAGHAQHMTSHIFLALGMWKESVEANLAAIAAASRRLEAAGKPPVRCGHYPSWLAYSYLQLGKSEDALKALGACRLAVEARAASDHPHPGHDLDPDESQSGSLENMRLRYLIDTGDWKGDVAGWALPATVGPGGRLDHAFADALGEIARGRVDEARQALRRLEAVGKEVSDSETKQENPDPSYRRRPDIFLLEARALLAEHEGDLSAAEKGLREAVKVEETLPIAFGPPTIDQPTHELLGEFLLRHDRKEEAAAEFHKALERTPGRRSSEQGLAAASS
jgi:tetratricopeptide (TPR) repeat protein